MAPVHIGVSHDDNPVVAQPARIPQVRDARTDCRNEDLDRLVAQHLVEPGLLHVQYLTEQRQNRLAPPIPTLLGRAACRVALDYIKLRPRRIALRAVGQLTRQRRAFTGVLAYHVTRLA